MADEFDLGKYGADIVLDDKKFTKGMKEAEGKLETFGAKTKSFGKGIGKIAGGTIAGLGAALVGAGIAGINMAQDLQKSLNDLQAKTGATKDEMKDMEKSIKSIYNANLGKSFEDIANSMADVKQTTGLTGKALENVTKNALLLRDTFDYDVKESVKASDQLMKQFGITGKKSMEYIAEGTQAGLNASGDFLDTINEYSVYFKTAGLSAKDMFAIYQNASKAGVRNLDFVGDAIKELVIRSKDMSSTTKDAFKSLGLNAKKMGADMAAGGERGRNAYLKIMKSLGKVKNAQERNRIGVELFGTKFEDLEAKGILAMGNLKGSIDGTHKSLKQINKVKYSTFGAALQGIKRNFQTALITPLKKYILPLLSQFSQFIIAHMPQIKAFISTTFQVIGKIIKTTIAIVQKLIGVFTDSSKSTNKNFSKIRKIISQILKSVMAIISGFVKLVTVIWKKYGEDIVKFVKSSFQNILQVIQGVLTIIRGIIKVFTSLLTGDFSGALEGLEMIFKGAFEAIGGIINQALNAWHFVINVTLKTISSIFSTIFGGIVSIISHAVSSAYHTVKNTFNSMKSKVSSIFSDIWSTARRIFNRIESAITSPVSSALGTIKSIVRRIKDAFDFNWSLPDIDLPHVSVDVDWAKVGPVSIPYPDFNVSWYAKGGYFDKPSLIGIGEAGPEMALPLIGKRMEPFAQAVAEDMSKNNGTINNHNVDIELNPVFNLNVKDAFDVKKHGKEITEKLYQEVDRGMSAYGL